MTEVKIIDPRTSKKTKRLYKKVFADETLYDLFFSYYDEAVADGSAIPLERAWIKFREHYMEVDNGWVAYDAG